MPTREGLAPHGLVDRGGGEVALRAPLERLRPDRFEEECDALEPILTSLEASADPNPACGGRPATGPRKSGQEKAIRLSSGITIVRSQDAQGHAVRLRGKGLSEEVMAALIAEINQLLELFEGAHSPWRRDGAVITVGRLGEWRGRKPFVPVRRP